MKSLREAACTAHYSPVYDGHEVDDPEGGPEHQVAGAQGQQEDERGRARHVGLLTSARLRQ